MDTSRLRSMLFSKIYSCYVQKAEKKGKTVEDVDTIICWLTGYEQSTLTNHKHSEIYFGKFFDDAPQIHPNAAMISGNICGYKVQDIEDPFMKKVRQLDKLIDELAKGKNMESILRS